MTKNLDIRVGVAGAAQVDKTFGSLDRSLKQFSKGLGDVKKGAMFFGGLDLLERSAISIRKHIDGWKQGTLGFEQAIKEAVREIPISGQTINILDAVFGIPSADEIQSRAEALIGIARNLRDMRRENAAGDRSRGRVGFDAQAAGARNAFEAQLDATGDQRKQLKEAMRTAKLDAERNIISAALKELNNADLRANKDYQQKLLDIERERQQKSIGENRKYYAALGEIRLSDLRRRGQEENAELEDLRTRRQEQLDDINDQLSRDTLGKQGDEILNLGARANARRELVIQRATQEADAIRKRFEDERNERELDNVRSVAQARKDAEEDLREIRIKGLAQRGETGDARSSFEAQKLEILREQEETRKRLMKLAADERLSEEQRKTAMAEAAGLPALTELRLRQLSQGTPSRGASAVEGFGITGAGAAAMERSPNKKLEENTAKSNTYLERMARDIGDLWNNVRRNPGLRIGLGLN